jgi:integrase
MAQKLKKYIDPKGRSYPGLYRDEVTQIFYLRNRALGKISLETDIAKNAIAKLHTAYDELERRKNKAVVSDKQNVLMRDLFEKMIALKKADEVSEATLRRIGPIWKKSIEPFWGDVVPSDINQEKVDDFKDWHRRNRPGIQFVNVFKYLGNLFNLAVDYGYLPREKLPKLELPKNEEKHHASKKGRIVKHEEFLAIADKIDERFLLIVTIAYYMGMRMMEIGKLECKRVIKEGGKVYIDLSHFDTKTGIPRTIPVPGFLAEGLLELARTNERYVFPMVREPKRFIAPQMIDRTWRAAKEAANIQGRIRFHDLRHTAATNMARRDINPVLAVTYLGMSLKTYQKTYLKLSKEDLLVIAESAAKLFTKPGEE